MVSCFQSSGAPVNLIIIISITSSTGQGPEAGGRVGEGGGHVGAEALAPAPPAGGRGRGRVVAHLRVQDPDSCPAQQIRLQWSTFNNPNTLYIYQVCTCKAARLDAVVEAVVR